MLVLSKKNKLRFSIQKENKLSIPEENNLKSNELSKLGKLSKLNITELNDDVLFIIFCLTGHNDVITLDQIRILSSVCKRFRNLLSLEHFSNLIWIRKQRKLQIKGINRSDYQKLFSIPISIPNVITINGVKKHIPKQLYLLYSLCDAKNLGCEYKSSSYMFMLRHQTYFHDPSKFNLIRTALFETPFSFDLEYLKLLLEVSIVYDSRNRIPWWGDISRHKHSIHNFHLLSTYEKYLENNKIVHNIFTDRYEIESDKGYYENMCKIFGKDQFLEEVDKLLAEWFKFHSSLFLANNSCNDSYMEVLINVAMENCKYNARNVISKINNQRIFGFE